MYSDNIKSFIPFTDLKEYGIEYSGFLSEQDPMYKGTRKKALNRTKCIVCGERAEKLTAAHLKKHGMTVKRYLEMFYPQIVEEERQLNYLANFLMSRYVIHSVRDNNYIYKPKLGFDPSKPFPVKERIHVQTLKEVVKGYKNVALTFGRKSKWYKDSEEPVLVSKLIAFDIDVPYTKVLKAVVDTLCSYGIAEKDIIKSESGSKGYHAEVILSEFLPFAYLKKFTDMVKEEVINLTKLESSKLEVRGCNGQAYKIPFGLHPVTKKRCHLVDSEGNLITDWETALRKHDFVSIDVIKKALSEDILPNGRINTGNVEDKIRRFESKYTEKKVKPIIDEAIWGNLNKSSITEGELKAILDELPSFDTLEEIKEYVRTVVAKHPVNLTKALMFMKYGVHEHGMRNTACSFVMIYRSEYMGYTPEQNLEWVAQWIKEKCTVEIFDEEFLSTLPAMAYSIYKNPNDKHLGKGITTSKPREVLISSSFMRKLANLEIEFNSTGRGKDKYRLEIKRFILAFYIQHQLHGTSLNDYTFNLPYSVMKTLGVTLTYSPSIKNLLNVLEENDIITIHQGKLNQRKSSNTVRNEATLYKLSDQWVSIDTVEGDKVKKLVILDENYRYTSPLSETILEELAIALLGDNDRKKIVSGALYRKLSK